MNEFNDALLKRFAAINARPDPINRCDGEDCHRNDIADWLKAPETALVGIASTLAQDLEAVNFMPEVTMLRVENDNGEREIYTLIRNRAHTNVAFMLGESLRYQPPLDSLTIYPGVLASYPNFMFNVKAKEVEDFVSAMQAIKKERISRH